MINMLFAMLSNNILIQPLSEMINMLFDNIAILNLNIIGYKA